MNAIERRNRRVGRLVIITEINEIEQTYCHVCPNRKSKDLSACKACPIAVRLNDLGKQLSGMSDRTNAEKIYDEPTTVHKKPGRKSKVEKKQEPGLTREIFLKERASGLWVMEIQNKYNMSRTALYHYLKKWGFRYLSQDRAKELLAERNDIA